MTTMVNKWQTLPYEDLELAAAGFTNPRPGTNPGMDPKSIRELANDILANGLEQPLVVWAAEMDRVVHNVVLRGQRRYQAIGLLIKEGKANGFEDKVPVVYSTAKTLAEAMLSAIRDFVHGEPLTTAELAEHMAKMRQMGYSGEDIAKALGKSPSWVSRILGAYEAATPELREQWQRGSVTDENAKALAKLPAAAQAEAVREHVATRAQGGRKSKSTAREVAKAKSAAAAPPKTSKKKPATPQANLFARRSPAEIDDLRNTLQRCEHAKVFGMGSARQMLTGMLLGVRWATGDLRTLPGAVDQAIKKLHAIEAKKNDGKTKAR